MQIITVTESSPTAAFTPSVSSGNGALTVIFTDNSVFPTRSNFTTWSWTFQQCAEPQAEDPRPSLSTH